MTADSPKVTIHMVASLDGFIAKPDNDISWLDSHDTYDKGVVNENPEEFLKTIGCYVMGSRTYEHAVELAKNYGWAYGDTPTIVLTHRELPRIRESIELYSGNLRTLVDERLKPRYESIWVVGGAAVVRDCLRAGLVDEVRLTIAPVLLGAGTPFFDRVEREHALHLKDITAYKNGMVELWYETRPSAKRRPST